MALSKIDAANFLTGTIPTSVGGTGSTAATLPASLINNTSIGNVTALPAAITTGTVLQLLNTSFGSNTTSSSSTYADVTGASLSITPSSSSNKIYVSFTLAGMRKQTNNTYIGIKLFRQINGGGYSEIEKFENGLTYSNSTIIVSLSGSYAYLDTPSTTNQIDYKIQFNSGTNSAQVTVNNDSQENSHVTLMEVSA